jgi:DNA-directed RNA polymerase subunit H
MATNHEDITDILFRSRITLLDHLEECGYDTESYRKFSTKEVTEMIRSGTLTAKSTAVANAPLLTTPALQMNLKRRADYKLEEGEPTNCLVVYALLRIKQKVLKFTEDIFLAEDNPYMNPETTELIVMTMEPIVPNFHAVAARMWATHSHRVRYFQSACLINNPLKHVLVPKHEKVPKAEEDEILKRVYAKKSQFPLIRYHEDPIARVLGLMPKDMVKITRPSPTAGECVLYRVCVA